MKLLDTTPTQSKKEKGEEDHLKSVQWLWVIFRTGTKGGGEGGN